MRPSLKILRSGFFIALLLLTACASPPVGVAYDLPAKNKFEHCPYQNFVGKNIDDAQKILEADKRTFRILEPDSAMTMDYSEDRVNLVYNPDTKIVERTFCG
jgi:hypothetical protein